MRRRGRSEPAGEAGPPGTALPLEDLRLANGMRLLLQPDRRVPLIALHLRLGAGSRDDPPRLCGLAHLCEHVAAFDTRNGAAQSHNRRIERCGGWSNGATSYERTSFTTVLPAHQLALGVWVEALRISRPPRCTPGLLEVQRKVVLEERRQTVENRPYGGSFELLHGLLYPSPHPYGRPPGGVPEGLAEIRAADVEDFLGRHYAPSRAVLAIVGDFDGQAVAQELADLLGGLPEDGLGEGRGGESGEAGTPMAASLPAGERRAVVAQRVPSVRAYAAFRAPGHGSRGWYAATLWARLLALGRSSPLQQRLVWTTGIAQEVHAEMATMRDASTVALVATASPGVATERLTAALAEAVQEVCADGISEPALRRARKKALTDHYARTQRLDHRAGELASAAASRGDLAHLGREDRLYEEIGLADLATFGRECTLPANRALLSIEPRGAGC